MSDKFLSFFEQSTRIVERALTDPYDIMVDYTASEDTDRYVRSTRPRGTLGFSWTINTFDK